MIDIQQHETYEVRAKLRATWRGQQIKQSCAAMEGETLIVDAGWLMDEDEKYPGEWALLLQDEALDRFGIGWIASGDVEILRKAASMPVEHAHNQPFTEPAQGAQ